jgi:hypothetical protein
LNIIIFTKTLVRILKSISKLNKSEMMFSINVLGEDFFLKSKRELKKLLISGPIFSIVVGFLFILGSKNSNHLYFSIFLLIVFIVIIIYGSIRLLRSITHTINKVSFSGNTLTVQTFQFLIFRKKNYVFNMNDLIYKERQIQVYKSKRSAWIIRFDNFELVLIKDFFNEELFEYITSLKG